VSLSQSKIIIWRSFLNNKKSYIPTGDSQCSLDLSLYQEAQYQFEGELNIEEVLPPQVAPKPNLFFDPPTSPENFDNSDYQPRNPVLPFLI
jgi:hypothetical protein